MSVTSYLTIGRDVEVATEVRLELGLRAAGVLVRGVDYAGEATSHIAVPSAAVGRLPHLLADLSGGELTAVLVGSEWVGC